MELVFPAISPWNWVITVGACALAVVIVFLLLSHRGSQLGKSRPARFIIVGFLWIAFVCFVLAGWNPTLTTTPDATHLHLVVLVDTSESVMRQRASWQDKLLEVSSLLDESIRRLEEPIRVQGSGSVVSFGQGATDFQPNLKLSELVAALPQLDRVPADSSNIAAGLERAGTLIDLNGGQGAVLLLSDGNELIADGGDEQGKSLTIARQLAQRGIPVHVIPMASPPPGIGITGANLPRQVNGGAETFLRAQFWNSLKQPVSGKLTVQVNPGLDTESRFASDTIESNVSIAPVELSTLRWGLQVNGAGIQFADLIWTPQDGSGEQRRRFFTHVVEPMRLLAIGGDNSWLAVLPGGMFEVEQIEPRHLSDYEISEWDAVVLSAVSTTQFPSGTLDALADAVKNDGTGLMIMNGAQHSTDLEAPTLLMSYDNTPIQAMLPVTNGPRPYLQPPPERNVVFVIDRSGSMNEHNGLRFALAKKVTKHLIQEEMRETDFVDVILFDTGSELLVNHIQTTAQNKSIASRLIDDAGLGGGTDPTIALKAVAEKQLTECGLILITDLGFDLDILKRQRPECQRTIFTFEDAGGVDNPSIDDFGQLFIMPYSFDPSSIRMTYFKPEERKKFFEPGEFKIFPPNSWARSGRPDSLPIPELVLNGSAVTQAKPDAVLEAVREQPIDPILVYRASGAGYVGVLTSAIPTSWSSDPIARQAVGAWIKRLVAYQARNRYDFKILDRGQRMTIEVAISSSQATGESTAASLPQVDSLVGEIQIAGQTVEKKTFLLDPQIPVTFRATFDIPRTDKAQDASLILTESGRDALLRPQRIPLVIPPLQNVSSVAQAEAFTYGLNEGLLREIQETGRGIYDPKPGGEPLLAFRPEARHETPLWEWLAVIGFFALFISVAVQRLDL